MKVVFGDIVVVLDNLIGVVVKNRGTSSNSDEPKADVYIRSLNTIEEFPISAIERYQVRHKNLDEDEINYQRNAENEA